MQQRHLTHEQYTLAAIDDIIDRGRWADWGELRAAAVESPDVLRIILRVCEPRLQDPYAQRHHFWMHYVRAHRAAS